MDRRKKKPPNSLTEIFEIWAVAQGQLHNTTNYHGILEQLGHSVNFREMPNPADTVTGKLLSKNTGVAYKEMVTTHNKFQLSLRIKSVKS